MKIEIGNILDITKGTICQQVNCKKVAGAGLAMQIRNKYPKWYKEFLEFDGNLGEVFLYKVNELTIASLYSQENYGRLEDRYTDYDAFLECLYELKSRINVSLNEKIYFPYKIGCGLGKGDWRYISKQIEFIFPESILVKLR